MHTSIQTAYKRVLTLWNSLIEPGPGVEDAAQRQQARLLSGLLLAGLIVGLLVAVMPQVFFSGESWTRLYTIIGLADCVILIILYRIARQGYYYLAVGMLAIVGTIAILANAMILGGVTGLHILYYLSIPLIFVCTLLPTRRALLYSTLPMLAILTFATLDDAVSMSMVFNGPLVFNLALVALILLIVRHRARIDQLMQADLLEAKERYRLLAERTYDFAYVLRVEPDGSLVREWLTDTFVRTSGYSISEVDVGNGLQFYHPDDREPVAADLVTILRGEARTEDYRAIRKDGSERWLRLSRFPVWDDAHERVVRIYGMARDVTDERLAEERQFEIALARARTDLVSRFFRAVSHDFRTSLAIIETNRYLILRLLDRGELDDIPMRIDYIGDQIERLTHQLENMKEVSALSSPITDLCDMNQLILNQVEDQRVQIDAKKLHLTVHTDPTAPTVRANVEKLGNAISHLLDNAVHFTPEGGAITLTVYHDTHTVMVDIQDTGVGISTEDAPHIFDFFYRADEARSIESGGIGLGLSIAKMVADAYGGTIIVDSKLGEGSTFTLAFPAASEPIPALEAETA